MKILFDQSSLKCSKVITSCYSTSFSLGIRLFATSIRPAIYSIYGFVRYADEIVDSFHNYNQEELFYEFVEDYEKSINRKISLNPILNSFQRVVHQYKLHPYVKDFIKSMERDLYITDYKTKEAYQEYIYGSADVVGLMCLRVFVKNNEQKFNRLQISARHLGAAFQKINFLRDFKQDTEELGRIYFPELYNGKDFNCRIKSEIIKDIEKDFDIALDGIKRLPIESKFGVYIAYKYYFNLLAKLKRTSSDKIKNKRIRISNPEKLFILTKSYIKYKLYVI
ncbi:phytoene/squalene synthase family protein [Galbibacter sp. PAP.153]|uniref:phytoene/squalene synthase family protein n=1 Tax=Galbibacter sp. PAP.153 TaxID=3104623 RepID=UPI00300A0103